MKKLFDKGNKKYIKKLRNHNNKKSDDYKFLCKYELHTLNKNQKTSIEFKLIGSFIILIDNKGFQISKQVHGWRKMYRYLIENRDTIISLMKTKQKLLM